MGGKEFILEEWLLMANCAQILHLNIDGGPKLKKCFYIK